MPTLICGSLAYDNIMTFEGRFRDHILPDQIHILNVSFLVPTLRREYGGCAGNIAYNLHLLGGNPVIMAAAGDDAAPYLSRLQSLGLPTDHIRVIEGAVTANGMITTDLENNQIAAFHPGAMSASHLNKVSDASGITLGIVAPDGKEGMQTHMAQFADASIPVVFDPGQGLPLFDGESLRTMVEQATYVAVNDYEIQLLSKRTGWSADDIAARVRALLITRGEHGVQIRAGDKQYDIPAVQPERIVDPTGCGDAFRGGLLYGLERGFDWETTGRLANLMGSLKIAEHGPQSHAPTLDEIRERFVRAFGYAWD